MQATVSDYDPRTRSGTVLLDDGVRLPFSADALDGSRLRLLRRGQRVQVRLDADSPDSREMVTSLQILTLTA